VLQEFTLRTFKIKSINFLTNLIRKLLGWYYQVFKLSNTVHPKEFDPLLNSILKIGKSRGLPFLIEYMKRVRLSLLHHLSGEYPEKRVEGVRVTKEGIPVVLGPLIKYIRNKPSPAMLQMVLTVCFSTRALNLGKDPDISTVTRPCESKIADISKYTKSFWRELGYRPSSSVPRDLLWKKFHFTTKSGPNGHALYSSTQDLFTLPPELVEDIKRIGGPELSLRMEGLITGKRVLASIGLPVEGKSFRKITWFPDREMKVRVIAIGDYWSQTALKPLHHYLFRVLKKIPQDCTFDQGSFLNKISGWNEFYSIDLSAATDRFPIQTIKDVLKGHLPEDYLDSWERIMVGYPFDSKLGALRYAVGNPMGFYSSWNSFTVAHHYVMYYCCKELTIPYKSSKYVMLGDDVLIGDRQLALKYMEVIQSLGCEFSPLKSHVSSKLCEFAKRYVYNGVEISPFPVSSAPTGCRPVGDPSSRKVGENDSHSFRDIAHEHPSNKIGRWKGRSTSVVRHPPKAW
jgi:hypothetical protein